MAKPAWLKDRIALLAWPKDALLHRVHPDCYAAGQFNPGVRGNARFSQIKHADGHPIPTLYAGTTLDCALMETVFHDVPFVPGLKTVDESKLAQLVHSRLIVRQALTLVDLRNVALRKLGFRRTELIDTEKDLYPQTRAFAERVHAECPDAQGLCWMSRQDDSARAVMLFGDRIAAGVLMPHGPGRGLGDEAKAEVVDLAERIGVCLV
ncbi:MAG: RES family NAD+ phosphorylase [Paludibacterium sp.]|uniref:RES family NAD+ phosphorylase n=1 Tax=Paludibacterium sp. TaxID=1917523 RepID=UPI0025CC9797|nr:RES family NAD+ phosphorylase [Paludibacterium sp.]MBV8048129.1 RES family NAD+ phosphorylase [Paludibacterium sp.]MBV8647747.1 RES family NAD+ phosphorylase [Paludibacterium sp.]